MTSTSPLRSPTTWLWIAAALHGAILLLGLVPAFAPRLWGANAWSFLQAPMMALVLAGAAAVGLIVLRAPAFPRRTATQAACALVGVPFFLLLRDETHLLGDGRLWVSVLGGARVYHAHEPLAFAAARVVTSGLPAGDATAVAGRLELFSILLGVAALVFLFRIADKVSGTARGRWAAFGLMAAAGALQFGAGYVEAYPLLWVALLLVVDSALGVMRGTASPLRLAVAAGLAAGVHGMSFLALPAVAWLLWRSSATARARLLAAAALAAPILVGYGLLPYILPSAKQMAEGVETTAGGVLQILKGLKPYPWGPAAWALDQLNRWTLAAPLALPLLLGARLQRRTPGDETVTAPPGRPPGRKDGGRKAPLAVAEATTGRGVAFLLLVGLPLVLPGLLLDTESARGAAVDWDAFAVSVVPLTVLVAALWAPRVDAGGSSRAAALAVTVGFVGTLAFLAVNADPNSAVARFDSLARHTFRTPRARAWGFEALAGYRRDSGDLAGALEAYERALEAMPKHPRLLSNTATLYSRGNRHPESAALYRRMTEAAPNDYNGWFYWGVESEVIGRFEDAEQGYRGALRINDRATDAMIGLARVRLRTPAGLPEARELLRRSLELAPDQPHAAGIRKTLESLSREPATAH